MYRVLVADDDPVMLSMIATLLHKEGHQVIKTTSADGVLAELERTTPDMLLIDINLPDRNGLSVCSEIRQNGEFDDMPIVFLTAGPNSPDNIADALNMGGDDFISKPFAARELAARVRAQLRRVQVRRENSNPSIRMVPATEQAYIDGNEVELTRVEFALLQQMCQKPNEWQTTRELLVDVWSYPGDVGDAALVRNHIRNLRRKIEDDPDRPKIILSRHRRGYMVAARVEMAEETLT
jgi:two-component system, OmpR family, response regulator MtrA